MITFTLRVHVINGTGQGGRVLVGVGIWMIVGNGENDCCKNLSVPGGAPSWGPLESRRVHGPKVLPKECIP